VAALALATCSAAFSISGLTSIFAGAFWPVIGLGVVADLDRRVAQIDTAIEQTTAHGRGKAAMALAATQEPRRARCHPHRRGRQACRPQGAEGRRGRPRPGAVFGDRNRRDDEVAMRYFILVVALLLDPAAVLLLLAHSVRCNKQTNILM
jgi:hypothetical protein